MQKNGLNRLIAACAAAIWGGALAAAMVWAEPGLFSPPGFVLSAAGGAGLAGAVMAPGFGRRGAAGWAWAAASGVIATALGSGFALILLEGVGFLARDAALLLVVQGVIFGMVTSHAGLATVWLGMMALVHLAMRMARDRRPGATPV